MTWELEEASSLSANLFKRKSYIKAHSHQTKVKTKATRMHSSMMRTVRSSSHLRAGGVSAHGGVSEWGVCPRGFCPEGMSARGFASRGVCPGGCLPGGLSTQGGYKHTPVDRMVDAFENITLRQYVADGKKLSLVFVVFFFDLFRFRLRFHSVWTSLYIVDLPSV